VLQGLNGGRRRTELTKNQRPELVREDRRIPAMHPIDETLKVLLFFFQYETMVKLGNVGQKSDEMLTSSEQDAFRTRN
jgi:hypothetical protein